MASPFVSGHRPRTAFGAVLVTAPAALLAACLACSRSAEQQPVDILLITIDTLRADVLEPYGATDMRTPNIARLAEDGVVFEAATTPITVTHPAHSSILTGLYPDQHGVLHNGHVLPDEVVTLAEILEEYGYQTGGFVGVRFLGHTSGLGQGFDVLDAPVERVRRRAKNVVQQALEWLSQANTDTPVLTWVHLFDPHQGYNPPAAFRRGADAELFDSIPQIRWETLDRIAAAHDGDIPAEVLEYALELYRGEVEYTDHQVGRLIKRFDRLRNPVNSLVVMTADHGECFENGIYFDHQDCLYEGTVGIPLIVRFPEGRGAGLRVGHRVSNLDIVPTVLSILERPVSADLAGRPLQESFSGSGERMVLIRPPQTRYPDRVIPRLRNIRSVAGRPVAPPAEPGTRGLVTGIWKYLQAPGVERLFGLPDEVRDRSLDEEETLRRLHEALAAEQRRFPPRGPAKEIDDEAAREMLEALGYVQ